MKTEKDMAEKVELIYFSSYSDFSYSLGNDFCVKVVESSGGHTLFSVSQGDMQRNVITVEQEPLRVFRNISPDELIVIIRKRLLCNFALFKSDTYENVERMLVNMF